MSTETTEVTETVYETGTLELISRGRKTGVIVGLHPNVTNDMAVMIREQLQLRYPHVVVSCVPATSSIAFEWDEDDEIPKSETSRELSAESSDSRFSTPATG